jgi:phosphotransferase system enzyme I (PtsI)
MIELEGIPSSGGSVIGKALVYLENALPEIPRYKIRREQITKEWGRFLSATSTITDEIRQKLTKTMSGSEQHNILKARLFMFEDIEFHESIKNTLEQKQQNLESVIWDISQNIIHKLSMLPDANFRERASDISDMAQELLSKLLSIQRHSLAALTEAVIVVARDILPSQALAMDKNFVKAIVTDSGSDISHTAIIARSLGIPAVTGIKHGSTRIKTGNTLIVDGNKGLVFIEPDSGALSLYQKTIKEYHARLKTIKSQNKQNAKTTDGKRFILKVNTETPDGLKAAIENGAEGVGLYRSEFTFLANRKTADEEEQYRTYSEMLKSANGLPITIRTLDAGGDKIIPALSQDIPEKNPILGWRSIRVSLSMPDVFMTQLRAILRASVYGKVRILFPLVSGVEELEQALGFLEKAKADCAVKKQPYSDSILAGTMIETPSAALVADKLIKKSDFFSIGSNDLIQYTLGVDRGNEKVNYLARPEHPAILRLIKMTIDAAHKKGKPVSLCGEMAGNTRFTALLAGLGLDEFSMNAAAIPDVKRAICEKSFAECQKLAQKALRCASAKEVALLLN